MTIRALVKNPYYLREPDGWFLTHYGPIWSQFFRRNRNNEYVEMHLDLKNGVYHITNNDIANLFVGSLVSKILDSINQTTLSELSDVQECK